MTCLGRTQNKHIFLSTRFEMVSKKDTVEDALALQALEQTRATPAGVSPGDRQG